MRSLWVNFSLQCILRKKTISYLVIYRMQDTVVVVGKWIKKATLVVPTGASAATAATATAVAVQMEEAFDNCVWFLDLLQTFASSASLRT